jgi:hypothetical protein
MLRNFENETCNLSEDELKIAQSVMNGLKKYVGKSNAIAGTKICSGFNNNTDFKLQTVRLRKIINYLRNQGEPICSSSKGYFMPSNKQEIKDTCISIQQRIDSQVQIINELSKHI